MIEKKFVNTGVRLTRAQADKLDQLATAMNVSRNRVFGMLIDSAEVRAVSSVSVELKSCSDGHTVVVGNG